MTISLSATLWREHAGRTPILRFPRARVVPDNFLVHSAPLERPSDPVARAADGDPPPERVQMEETWPFFPTE